MRHGPVERTGEESKSRVIATDAGGGGERPRLLDENKRLHAEVQALKASGRPTEAQPRRRVRKGLTAVLVILVTICVISSTAGFWVQRTFASEDRYVALVAPLARDPAVTDALGTRLTDAAFVALDVQ